jgi:hypothetical protein
LLIGFAGVFRKRIGNKNCYRFSDLSFGPPNAYLGAMKDLNALMQQAQAMQQKLQDAQAKMAETTASGTSGGGLVTVALKGPGDITSVVIDDSLLVPGEGEILADLIVAAHADAKRRLDEINGALMREAAGPMAGMNIPGMPKLF